MVSNIQKLIGFLIIVASVLLFVYLSGCGDGFTAGVVTKPTDSHSDPEPDEPVTPIDIVYECSVDMAYDTLWCYCKHKCEEENGSKCNSSPKVCVNHIKLKNDNIQCVCKKCNSEEEANECQPEEEPPVEEDTVFFEGNIEKPYKPIYLEEELERIHL